MQLYEFQAKRIFGENGITIPKGRLCKTSQEAAEATKLLGKPVIVKAQVLAGGRGLAGGVKAVQNPEEAHEVASQILGMTIKGEKPVGLIVEERIEAIRELYAGVTYDYGKKLPVIMASSRGGVDIETIAKDHPAEIARKDVDPFKGFSAYQGRELAAKIGLNGNSLLQYASIAGALWNIFSKYDAELAEVNPIAVLADGSLVALDAKLNLDDKSLARQSSLLSRIEKISSSQIDGPTARRIRARELGIPTYIEMDGNIGVIADGAGTGMLTLDLVSDFGGKTGVYCEMGGETTAELMEKTMLATLAFENTKVVLVNLIGGLNLMDEMAKGISNYLRNHPTKVPVVVRISGTNEDEGRRILNADGIRSFDNLYQAVEEAVKLSKGM
ncbi:MAG: succinate--CoA ligase subunit beta [archaeon]